MTNLIRLVQISDACAPLARADLADLIRRSNREHPAHELTGTLLHYGGHYLQVLEGPAEAVARAAEFDIAGTTPRRRRVHRLACDVTNHRLFRHWTAQPVNVSALSATGLARLRLAAEWAADATVTPSPGEIRDLLDTVRDHVEAIVLAA